MKQQWYGVQRRGSDHAVHWADFSSAAPTSPLSNGERAEYQNLAEAFHETAKYLLLKNKKDVASKPPAFVRSALR